MSTNAPQKMTKPAQAQSGPHNLSRRKRLQAMLLAAIAATLPACASNKWKFQVGPAHMDETGAPALGIKFPGLADPDMIDYLDGTLNAAP